MKTLKNIVGAMAILFTATCVGFAGPKTSQTFTLEEHVTVNGQALKPGDVEVRWITHSPQATVTFAQRKSTVTTDGVFVTRPDKAEHRRLALADRVAVRRLQQGAELRSASDRSNAKRGKVMRCTGSSEARLALRCSFFRLSAILNEVLGLSAGWVLPSRAIATWVEPVSRGGERSAGGA